MVSTEKRTATESAGVVAAAPRAWFGAKRIGARGAGIVLWVWGSIRGSKGVRRRRQAALLWGGRRLLVGPSRSLPLSDGRRLAEGIVSEARISEWMNLDHDAAELDARYAARANPVRDASVLARALWVSFIGRDRGHAAATGRYFNLFDVVVNNSDTGDILDSLIDMIERARNAPVPAHVCFVNANNFNLAVERPDFMRILKSADLVLPDGIGVKLALRMAGGSLRRNLNGTDLFPLFMERLLPGGGGLFLLGADPETLARACAAVRDRFPGVPLLGCRDGYFKEDQEPSICEEINASGADVLVVGMGTPRQEMWVARNLHRLRTPLVMSMGGLLDFLGGKNKRAPDWMRQTGLEWIFRIIQEPGRMWKRYVVGNPVFLWRAYKWIRSGRAVAFGAPPRR